jgi:NADPH2:quinone reductase
MRAAWYERNGEAQDVLQVGELPTPEPGPGEVRVRLRASGVNPADVKRRKGNSRTPAPTGRVTPHFDGAGEIDKLGSGKRTAARASASGSTKACGCAAPARRPSSSCCRRP